MVSASYYDDKIAWYENLMVSGIAYQQSSEMPKHFRLYPNYPNPFNPVTHIAFDIPQNLPVVLKIYDISGREGGDSNR